MTAAVVTASAHATAAARRILADGGNAVDAAAGAAWALAVCEPAGSGLGGQCVMTIAPAGGAVRVIDGHSHAPAAASTETIDAEGQRMGRTATTIPSLPATLELARRRFGQRPLAAVLQPAIELAADGYPIGALQYRDTRLCAKDLRRDRAARRLFLREAAAPPAGTLFRQRELTATLCRLVREGVEDFYCGGIARDIVEDHETNGGLIRAHDLAAYAPVECAPLEGSYRGLRILSAPPPAGGLQLLRALHLLEALEPAPRPGAEPPYAAFARAIRATFIERELLDSAAAAPLDFDALLTPEMIRRVAAGALVSAGAGRDEPGETTHVCVVDGEGNAVSLTSSIQSLFGSKTANARLGFVYNNYLRTAVRRPHRHALGPQCVPRSNASPTMVLAADGKPRIVLGAAGSRRIVSGVLQVIARIVDRGESVADAIGAPRVHATASDVWIEEPAATSGELERLRAVSPHIAVKGEHSYALGCVHGIVRTADGLRAAADPRREGTAFVG